MNHIFISTSELSERLGSPGWVIVDCRYNLADPDQGFRAYRAGHVPGAVYADLAKDLSGPVTGKTGRHPLPDLGKFVDKLSGWGIDLDKTVVALDESDGSLAAGRLWWMLRFLGHDRTAVLDGGHAKWVREGRPLRSGIEHGAPARFVPRLRKEMLVSVDEVDVWRRRPDHLVVDSRSPERFRGEVEPFDPVAGRIPGAVNRFHRVNTRPDGTIRPAEELRAEFADLLGCVPPENAVLYCGSGVTSVANLMAMEQAGLPGARLYVGSWSEWCSDPKRDVARGSE